MGLFSKAPRQPMKSVFTCARCGDAQTIAGDEPTANICEPCLAMYLATQDEGEPWWQTQQVGDLGAVLTGLARDTWLNPFLARLPDGTRVHCFSCNRKYQMGVNGTFITVTPEAGSKASVGYLPACAVCLNQGWVTFVFPEENGRSAIAHFNVDTSGQSAVEGSVEDAEHEPLVCSVCSLEVYEGLNFCINCKHPYPYD